MITKEDGSVSVCLIIVIVALFLFHAVLIDYARILAAEKQSEQAVKAAVRSVLSSYDSDLQKYGLFGFEGDAEAVFRTVMQGNLSNGTASGFHWVDTRLEAGSVALEMERPLAQTDILKHQMLEEMKYRAPIEWTVELVHRLNGIAGAMQQASTLVHTSTSILDDLKRRDELLEQAQVHVTAARELIHSAARQRFVHGTSPAEYPTVSHLNHITSHHVFYKSDINRLQSLLRLETPDAGQEEEIRRLTAGIETYERATRSLIGDVSAPSARIERELRSTREKLAAALDLNREIEKSIARNRKESEERYAAWPVAGSGEQDELASFGQLEQTVEQLSAYVLEEGLFTSVLEWADTSASQEKHFARSLLDLSAAVDALSGTVGSTLRQIERELRETDEASQMAISALADALEHLFNDTVDGMWAEIEQEEASADSEWQSVRSEVSGMTTNLVDLLTEEQAYRQLEQLQAKYDGGHADAIAGTDFSSSSAKQAAEFMNMTDALFAGLGELLLGVRDELYVNEFVLHKFNSKNPQDVLDVEDFLLEHREVEYILFGLHAPGANYALAVTSIFAWRFIVRFVDFFTTYAARLAPHPIAALFLALAYAAGRSLQDVSVLTSGGDVPLLERFSQFRLTYHDHLRMLFLIYPQQQARLVRVQSLLDYRLGQDLQKFPTYVKGSAVCSVRLWFLPEIAGLFAYTGWLDGKVNGNRYMFEVEGVYSY